MKVLGMGNALVDMMIRIDDERIFREFGLLKGGMRLVDSALIKDVLERLKSFPVEIATGGSAANTVHGLAKLGVKTSFIGKVASDDFGKFMMEDMLKNGVNPNLLNGKAPTGIALTLITPDSERTFAVNLGCAIELLPEDINADLYQKDPEKGRDFITDFSVKMGNYTVERWEELFRFLMVKFLDGNIKKEENGQFLTRKYGKYPIVIHPEYPEWWLKLIVETTGDKLLYQNDNKE
jgi:hypothetical protein